MNLLSDILTYIRRIIKSPSNTSISNDLLIDYVNRFWTMDVDARLQLFDLKTKYSFMTTPGVDQYNMPLYNVQTEFGDTPQTINFYPVYQGFTSPAYINGIQVPLQTLKASFFDIFPNIVQNLTAVDVGDGTANYTFTLPILPTTAPQNPPFNGILRGHVDMAGIVSSGVNVDPPIGTTLNLRIPSTSIFPAFFISTIAADGTNMIVTDSGQFLSSNKNYGLLMNPGTAPFGYSVLSGGYTTTLNTVNYFTGQVNVTFPNIVPAGNDINVSCYFFQSGLPRSILFYNNTLTLRVPPAQQYLVELDAYLTPAAFLSLASPVQFGYMSEYIARGAARKILTDTGDIEQFQFYEPLFREQEMLVWKRSQRQWTNNRTQTLYSQGFSQGTNNSNLGGGGTL